MYPGLPRETKWGHLRDLHAALRLSKKALLWGVTSAQKLGEDLEVRKSFYRAALSVYVVSCLEH